MDQDISLLEQLFGHFPEPVLYLNKKAKISYCNRAGHMLLPTLMETCPPELTALLESHKGEALCALPTGRFLVTVSDYTDGWVLVFRALSEDGKDTNQLLYSMAPYLRERLSAFSAALEYLYSGMGKNSLVSDCGKPLSILSQNIHRLLHLVRQLELADSLTDDSLPTAAPVDLTALCRSFTDEVTALAKLGGIQFTADLPDEPLPAIGHETLLRQMLMELLSNALKAAGQNGHVGLRLAHIEKRAVFTVWDDGPGIRQDRLPNLFDAELPTRLPFPGEGAGLGLFLARRVVKIHDGVIMAENRPEGGASLVVSLPISRRVSLRAPAAAAPAVDLENRSGFSPALVGLSDALPWQAFPPTSDYI